jgi:hypothetical protein
MLFFRGLTTVNEIKVEYRRLALLHHPDRGGDTATMQIVNAAYQEALAPLDGQINKGADGKDHPYAYNEETEQAIMDKIAELLGYKLADIEIEINGTWLWVGGETYQHRDILGAVLKMNFSGRHKRWSWHNGPKYRRRGKLSYDEIKLAYGSKKVDAEVKDTAVA